MVNILQINIGHLSFLIPFFKYILLIITKKQKQFIMVSLTKIDKSIDKRDSQIFIDGSSAATFLDSSEMIRDDVV